MSAQLSSKADENHQPSLQIPKSDVSASVGLVGVATLFGWIVFCRSWPQLAQALNLPVPHEVLSGPHAALLAMLLCGITMSLWSVLVDKVHRNPSTGLDWNNPKTLAETIDTSATKLAGLWVTWAVLAVLYGLGRWYWDGQYLFSMRMLGMAAGPMVILSVPYVLWLDRHMIKPRDHSWHFGAMLIGREPWDGQEIKKHWRAWIIKGFFTAFMLSILPFGFSIMVEADFTGIMQDPARFAFLLVTLLFTIDVQIGTVGYLLTVRPLDAHIRSGNPYLAGWVGALLCYPPFVHGFMGNNGMIGYEHGTAQWGHWLAGHDLLLWIWAGWLIILTAIYAWATFAFGIRFSNLTYRGVLTNGPYRFTRHPAYLSKNMFWWCSVMPFMVTNGSLSDAIRNTMFRPG